MHAARQAFIQNESREKVKCGLTSGDHTYTTGGLVFYKRANSEQCHGPGTVVGQDGKTNFGKIWFHLCENTYMKNNTCY